MYKKKPVSEDTGFFFVELSAQDNIFNNLLKTIMPIYLKFIYFHLFSYICIVLFNEKIDISMLVYN